MEGGGPARGCRQIDNSRGTAHTTAGLVFPGQPSQLSASACKQCLVCVLACQRVPQTDRQANHATHISHTAHPWGLHSLDCPAAAPCEGCVAVPTLPLMHCWQALHVPCSGPPHGFSSELQLLQVHSHVATQVGVPAHSSKHWTVHGPM